MTIAKLTSRLCSLSRQATPVPVVFGDWPAPLDETQWFFAPDLISLAGTSVFAQLSIQEQRRLSFFELINFFSINIHGERALLAGLARRLYAPRSRDVTAYLHHFIEEENRHSQLFGEFCLKYAGRTYPERKLAFEREYAAGEEDFLFFAKVLIFEEIVDYYNVLMGDDAQLHPLVRAIHRMHHADETRHLAFGRLLTAQLFESHQGLWSPERLAAIRAYLSQYIVATCREYHAQDAYRDAGMTDPVTLAEHSFNTPASAARRRAAAKRCIGHLLKSGILLEDPLS